MFTSVDIIKLSLDVSCLIKPFHRSITVHEHINNKKNALAIAFLCLLFIGQFLATANAGINEWSNVGLTNESISALAIDPHNSAIIYAGTGSSGIFRSRDSGVNWISINAGLTDKFILSLSIDPGNSAIIYAGTGTVVFLRVQIVEILGHLLTLV
jgi:hypothetical protein